jgi:hypothetical protein
MKYKTVRNIAPSFFIGGLMDEVQILTQMEVVLIAIGGKLSVQIMDAIKVLPWLSDEQKAQITGPLASLLSGIVSVVAGWLVGLVAAQAGWLTDAMPIKIGVLTYLASAGWFELGKLRGDG